MAWSYLHRVLRRPALCVVRIHSGVDLVGHSGVLRERLLTRRHFVLILAAELLRVWRLHRVPPVGQPAPQTAVDSHLLATDPHGGVCREFGIAQSVVQGIRELANCL